MPAVVLDAYSLERWGDLYLGVLGAAAALAGLLFVGLSVNLERIMALGGVAERGLETLALLGGILALSAFALVPQTRDAFGWEALVLAIVQIGGVSLLQRTRWFHADDSHRGAFFAGGAILNQLPGVLVAVGAATLLLGQGGGLYWLGGALVVTLVAALANAWVLLVEIAR